MKTLREWIDLVNEAQKSDSIDDVVTLDEAELDEQFVSKALPPADPDKVKAKSKVEQLSQKT